jgi:hypothetical protein
MTTTALTEIAELELFSVNELREKELSRLDLVALKAKTALDIDIVDKKTYDIVHDAQMECRNNRTRISKGRLMFTESLTKQTKDAIQCEKDLIARIQPTEEALKAKKDEYDSEQDRIKKEKEAAELQTLQDRIDELKSYGIIMDIGLIKNMSDDWFRMMADSHKAKWQESEKVRIEQETIKARQEADAEKKRQEELEEMRKFRAEQDIIAENNRKQAEENARNAQAIKDKENELKHQEELKQAQETARLQAIEDEKIRVENERLAKEAKDKADKERMEKEDSYKKFISDNEWKFDKIFKEDGKIVLYKVIAEFTI